MIKAPKTEEGMIKAPKTDQDAESYYYMVAAAMAESMEEAHEIHDESEQEEAKEEEEEEEVAPSPQSIHQMNMIYVYAGQIPQSISIINIGMNIMLKLFSDKVEVK
eukprot:229206-Amphidinium_carterae.1